MPPSIRVLIVDDSTYVRMVLNRILERASGIEVVGQAGDGQEALRLAAQLKPDVMTLDVEMPGLNGLEVLRQLLPHNPIAVVMLSSLTQHGAEVTLQALELGAVDFVGKPGSAGVPDLATVQHRLLMKVRGAARARVRSRPTTSARPAPVETPVPTRIQHNPAVLIASSTGGPGTLDTLLSALPPNLPAAFAITQHMPPDFMHTFAARLDANCSLQVREAAAGDVLRPATVLVAPGDYHMIIGPRGVIHLSHDAEIWGVRPAADPMMASAAENLKTPLIGVVLTGMGCDGAQGVVEIKRAGGVVVAEDEQSCVIYGMPKAAAETGACDYIVSLSDMPQVLTDQINKLATGGNSNLVAVGEG